MTAFIPVSSALAFSPAPSSPKSEAKSLERPRVITLCGSTRFIDEFDRQNRLLTLKGNVVLSVATKAHEGSGEVTDAEKELLDRVHFEKIRMSDEIFVINVGGYIGPSTKREIEYAKRLGRTIRYLVDPEAGGSLPR